MDESSISTGLHQEVVNFIKSNKQWECFDPSSFVLVKFHSFGNVHILNVSSNLCGMKIEFEDSKDSNQSFTSCIKLGLLDGGKQVGESSPTFPTKLEARDSAACKAMSFLSRVCPTIIIKDLSKYQEIEPVITHAQVCCSYGFQIFNCLYCVYC